MSSAKKTDANSKRRSAPRLVPALPGSPLEKMTLTPWSYVILLACVLVCYVHTLSFQWTRFDDDLIVADQIDTYKDFSKAGSSFTKDAFNREKGDVFYRPIQNLSFFLDVRLFGSDAAGFKITNLILHYLTCVSLMLMLRLLKFDTRLSFLAALVYAAHPLFNHAVIWIPARGDLCIALFGLLAYITFLQYMAKNRIQDLALHACFFFLAVFSKETALLFPLVFLLHLVLFDRPFKFSAPQIRVAALWAVVGAAYFYARGQVIVTGAKADEFGLLPLWNNLRALPELISKFVLPAGLSVMPVFSLAPTLFGTILLILLCVYVITAPAPVRSFGLVGLSWFFLFTSITMLYRNGLGKAAYDYLEHRAYLPMIGIVILLVSILQNGLPRWPIHKLCLAGMAAAVGLGSVTIVHSLDYRDPFTFYAAAIRSNPGCALAYYNRAQYKKSLGDRAGAILDYDEAIRVKPELADAFYNRGNARKEGGDLKGALLDYGEAIRFNAEFELAYYNRGTVRLNLADGRGAIEDLSAVLSLNPKNSRALNNRGAAYYGLGQVGPAMADFNHAIQIDPAYGDAWRNRGSVRFENRDLPGACSDWRSADRAGSAEAGKLYLQHCR
jgi:protein O-mannosyl-transferase